LPDSGNVDHSLTTLLMPVFRPL
ncbi:hypothetical protein ECEC1864_3272, partial [Escherichia coli EC1864]